MKPRTLGVEEIEKKEKAKQKEKAAEKKSVVAKAMTDVDDKEVDKVKVVKKSLPAKKPTVKKAKGAKYLKSKKWSILLKNTLLRRRLPFLKR